MTVLGLADRLTAVRKTERLSQEEMAQRIGISRSAYQYYERGQRDLTASVLLKIYEAFDIDPLWLLEGDTPNGNSTRYQQIAIVYRKIGLAIEKRISERGLSVTPEKKWDAIDFLFQDFLDFATFDDADSEPNTSSLDRVLKLVA